MRKLSRKDSTSLIALSIAVISACVLYKAIEQVMVGWFVPLDDREIVQQAEDHYE